MNEKRLPIISSHDFPADFQQPKWYVLLVRSNQEKKVAHGLGERGIEHLLPRCSSIRQWKDRRVKLELPLFPGYVFIRLSFLERIRALTVPYVVSLIGRKNSPSEITEDEISWLKSGTEHGQAEPFHSLEAGEEVMIVYGPMTGMKGILLRQQNSTRVVVSIQAISRAFVVEVDAACVEPVRTRLGNVG
jgi:transcription antitermination factor NusG